MPPNVDVLEKEGARDGKNECGVVYISLVREQWNSQAKTTEDPESERAETQSPKLKVIEPTSWIRKPISEAGVISSDGQNRAVGVF
jgi:hypothetical protein